MRDITCFRNERYVGITRQVIITVLSKYCLSSIKPIKQPSNLSQVRLISSIHQASINKR